MPVPPRPQYPFQRETYGTDPLYNFTVYDQKYVESTWPEYSNPRLTCLTVWIGNQREEVGRWRHCLLVERNGSHTVVERWRVALFRDETRKSFLMVHPGVVFEGDMPIERYQSGDFLGSTMLQSHFSWSNLSADLVARSSEFVGGTYEDVGHLGTVTELPLWSVILGASTIGIVAIAGVAVFLIMRKNELVKINTLDGLSSVLREEHNPTGDSLKQGEKAIVGFSITDSDVMRFGVLSSEKEAIAHAEEVTE